MGEFAILVVLEAHWQKSGPAALFFGEPFARLGPISLYIMSSLTQFLRYFFYPNPSGVTYTSTSAIVAVAVAVLLIALSFGIGRWRKHSTDARVKKLSRSWSSAALWFGIFDLILVVSRVEHIQYFAMRFMGVLWALALLVYCAVQVRVWRMRYYQVLPQAQVNDPRDKYLPGKKR